MGFETVSLLLLLALPCMSDLLSGVGKNNVKVSPCEACKKLVTSFEKGIERTSRGNFAGGDTAWEEEKLGSYHRSEVRLVEIQEKLCLDVEQGESQCHSLAEEAEMFLEEWWFTEQDKNSNLKEWLCISTMKLCCPDGHYGPQCKECPGYPNNICSNNGKCKGAGTRTGSGLCICNKEYAGKICDHCAPEYFEVTPYQEKLLCSPCNVACQGGCSDGTAKGCKSCKIGWKMDKNLGCVDIDECTVLQNVCKKGEACINNEGSFTCQDVVYGTRDPGKWARYATYISSCIACGIFLRKNVFVGSLVTLLAAVYISASEIVMNDFEVKDLGLGKFLGF